MEFGRHENKVLNGIKKIDNLVNYKANKILNKTTLNKSNIEIR